MPSNVKFTGGDKLTARLQQLAEKVRNPGTLRVGFLEGATYEDGTSVASIAAINEFGGRIEREPGEITIYRKLNADQSFANEGRFVKRKSSNFATTHYVGAYVITIPPRPFFRNMIKKNGGTWGDAIAALLKATQMDAKKSLALMGHVIEGELRQSIQDTNDPPNAPSTIRKKGSSKPLIDSGVMWQSVQSEVTDNETP